MLRTMITTNAQVILRGLLVALLGISAANGQSRLDAARAKERELTERAARAERNNPDSPSTDKLNQMAAEATHERQQIERQERLDAARTRERELTQAAARAERNNPDGINADRLNQMAAEATHERQRIEREGRQGSESPALEAARARERELTRAAGRAERNNPDGINADRLSQMAAAATYERQRLERREADLRMLNRQTVRAEYYGGYFDYRPISRYGHQYDAYNVVGEATSLWRLNVTTEAQAFAKITSRGMSQLIRSRPMNPDDDDSIVVGKRFILYHFADYVGRYPSPVEVTAMTDTSFTVMTLPGHPFRGTVKHEIVKDRSGNFWLHQSGTGVEGEPAELQDSTYYYAPGMWMWMSNRARELLYCNHCR